ncbi:MAG: ATP-binding protein [Pseudomonadota bacterium]
MRQSELDSPGAAPDAAGASGWQERVALPPQPKSVRDTGLDLSMLVELVSKVIFLAGKSHLSMLAARLRLPVNVLHEVLVFMLAEQMAEVARRGDADIDVAYQLTTLGRQRAGEALARNRYLGPAPVTLAAYRDMVLRQSLRRRPAIGAADIAAAFADISVPVGVRKLIGAAMYAGRSLLLYGPPGSGKSTLARRLGRLLQDVVALPHAVAVGEHIIEVYDPLQHLAPNPAQAAQLLPRHGEERRSVDARWLLCQRPVLQLGAELSAPMLALRLDAASGYYQAPAHFKANNGMLIIDDLGRQRVAAFDLLNRWIGPLDQGEDSLSLEGGQQFSVPFDTLMVFVTSADPASLFDPAFLRRLGYRVALGALGELEYRTLFRQQCLAARLVYDEAVLRHLIEQLHRPSARPLLACYPRELIGRILDFAGFAGEEPRLTLAALEHAWHSLFAGEGAPAGTAPPEAPAAPVCEAGQARAAGCHAPFAAEVIV